METKICNFKIEKGIPKKCTSWVAADVGWERSGWLTNAQDAINELFKCVLRVLGKKTADLGVRPAPLGLVS